MDRDGYDECDNHVSAETESSEITPIQKMARKATEEQKAAELKNKVQTVKKSPEEQQHTADDVLEGCGTETTGGAAKSSTVHGPLKKPGRLHRWKP